MQTYQLEAVVSNISIKFDSLTLRVDVLAKSAS